ncbi:MAG: hypothetical protein ABJA62_09330, partial [Luteimonas sp.]
MRIKYVAGLLLWFGLCVPAFASETLEDITENVDKGIQLDSAYERLQAMRIEDPMNPEILIQLARIEIKLATSGSDTMYVGIPSSELDRKTLEPAESLLAEAVKLNPNYADTWVLYGHLAYLKFDFMRSRTMLERAKALGTSNPWLHINLGDTLWAMGSLGPMSEELVRQAEREYQTGLAMKPSPSARTRAYQQLVYIYIRLRDVEHAKEYSKKILDMSSGKGRAYALHTQAIVLFQSANDVDGAIIKAREAMQVFQYPLGNN